VKRSHIIITTITLLVVLFVLNFLVAKHPVRIDLTENGQYTLSDSTRNILADLDDVVTIRIYFTQDLPPALKAMRRGVDDILDEFKMAAGEKIQIEAIDPGSSATEEQKVVMMGIPPVRLNVVEHDKQQVAKIFLGVAVLYGERQEVLPVVDRVENLEYELAVAVLKVSSNEMPNIAWWEAGYTPTSSDEGFEIARSVLGRRYGITSVTSDNLADLDVKNFPALVLASPRKMSTAEQKALSTYVEGGGHLVALIDRWEITPELIVTPIESGAVKCLRDHGIVIDDSIVLDHISATAAFSGGVVSYQLPYPYWVEVRRDRLNQDVPIVSDLESVILPWTSPITLTGDGAIGKEILAWTTDLGVAKSGKGKLDPQSAAEALTTIEPKSHDLIVRRDSIFVVGSSRWIRNRFVQNFPNNMTLLENAVDSFAIGDALIGIRSRANTSRPIVDLNDGSRLLLKYINVALGPIAMAIVGVIVFLLRRRSRRDAVRKYGQ
jgi:gliding motility-associatede transport system auxiliary component